MTTYRILNARRASNGQVELHIVVGKTDRVAPITLTREDALRIAIQILNAIRGPEPEAS